MEKVFTLILFFLDEGISIDTSQIGVQGQGSMAITPQVASRHRLYEGNPIQMLVPSQINHQKAPQMENFDINGMKNEVMAYSVEDGTHVT